jgi:hypothetical protein
MVVWRTPVQKGFRWNELYYRPPALTQTRRFSSRPASSGPHAVCPETGFFHVNQPNLHHSGSASVAIIVVLFLTLAYLRDADDSCICICLTAWTGVVGKPLQRAAADDCDSRPRFQHKDVENGKRQAFRKSLDQPFLKPLYPS